MSGADLPCALILYQNEAAPICPEMCACEMSIAPQNSSLHCKVPAFAAQFPVDSDLARMLLI
ncbi:hypothetical protein [Elstera cyanobacteriorum]|uniref:hypothetical protein n=1 Tax=Elstera cyanobacteriorum TaxID=2022747 RepID=UPI00114031FE|nr:hypothetical protein [Elstera cyanobacteriorum]